MEIRKLGEFGLIDKLTSLLEIKDKDVVVGFGDDCACVNIEGKLILFSSDIQIEEVHFIKEKISPKNLGWKLVSVNVSDIVACGGIPRWGLVSIAVPENTTFEYIQEVYTGIKEALDFYSFSIIGGNTAKSEKIIFDLFITGETDRFISRSGAKEGDFVYISGYTGLSRAGLELLLMDKDNYENWEEEIISFHTKPVARIDFLDVIRNANSCIDISDGLAGDLGHIEKQSKVKIVLEKEKLPVHPLLEKYCKKYNKNPYDYILYGGEDYQLAFTTSQKEEKGFLIGYVEKGEGVFLKEKEEISRLKEKGFKHI